MMDRAIAWLWPDTKLEDVRLLCELVLELNRRGFGRLRCFPQWSPNGMSLRCSIAISRESRPSNHHCWEHLWWLGMHGQRFKWELPAVGSASRSAAVLKANTSSDGFLAQVLGSEFSGDALGDSGGYAEWLGTVLARPEHIIPVLLWDWYGNPTEIETIPKCAARLPFPPDFFSFRSDLSGLRASLDRESTAADFRAHVATMRTDPAGRDPLQPREASDVQKILAARQRVQARRCRRQHRSYLRHL